MIAADCSNYARVPTQADIDALKALGVTRMIVGSSFSQRQPDGSYIYIAGDQMAAFEAAGFEVQEYMFVGRVYPTHRVWWLDVELSETADDVRNAVRMYRPHGIYTRRGIWNLLGVDLVSEFPGLKLWDANYGPLPRTFIPYGGWTKADMTQWHDTMDIGTGFNVDLNEYEEDAMTPAERAEINDLKAIAFRDAVKINAIDAGVKYLIEVVTNLAPRVTALEGK